MGDGPSMSQAVETWKSIKQLVFGDDWVGLCVSAEQVQRGWYRWTVWAEMVNAKIGVKLNKRRTPIKTALAGVVWSANGKVYSIALGLLTDGSKEGLQAPTLRIGGLPASLAIVPAQEKGGSITRLEISTGGDEGNSFTVGEALSKVDAEIETVGHAPAQPSGRVGPFNDGFASQHVDLVVIFGAGSIRHAAIGTLRATGAIDGEADSISVANLARLVAGLTHTRPGMQAALSKALRLAASSDFRQDDDMAATAAEGDAVLAALAALLRAQCGSIRSKQQQ